jgi:hypothetical protein
MTAVLGSNGLAWNDSDAIAMMQYKQRPPRSVNPFGTRPCLANKNAGRVEDVDVDVDSGLSIIVYDCSLQSTVLYGMLNDQVVAGEWML